MQFTKFMYEARPYFYGICSIYALMLTKHSGVMIISGVIMGICCITVSYLRYEYRKNAAIANAKMSYAIKKKNKNNASAWEIKSS